jgi:hypothetical protein
MKHTHIHIPQVYYNTQRTNPNVNNIHSFPVCKKLTEKRVGTQSHNFISYETI